MDRTILQTNEQTLIRPGTGRGAVIAAAASVVGGKEHAGPLGNRFDYWNVRDRFSQDTWEKAESEMQRVALETALHKASVGPGGIGILFAGDLLNQCTGSAYGLLSYDIPYVGLYGACSTCAEGLMMAAAFTGAGLVRTAAAVTSSHNAAAERQFRLPVEYGGQRPPTGQWTVTGAGAFVVTAADGGPSADAGGPSAERGGQGNAPAAPRAAQAQLAAQASVAAQAELARISACMPGIVVDKGITDPNNMGAAMAPAAESTLLRYFAASGTVPADYDLIVTGDLGREGGRILCDLMDADGCPIRDRYDDCGRRIYDRASQDTHSGGSGCGCSAVVLAADLLPRLADGSLSRILFLSTGAMMSPDSVRQGQGIPGVAHLLALESPRRTSGTGRGAV